MPISQSQPIHIACPACGARFDAEVWTLVDAAERPDLAQALRDDTLDVVTCPACGTNVPGDAPLLFHDPANRRVYFAVPPAAEEHAWRERAQELLYTLVGGIPEEQRRPYLGDVQVEQEVAGVRRAVLRRDRARGAQTSRQADKQTRGQESAPRAAVPPTAVSPSPPLPFSPSRLDESLLDAVRLLLAADSEAEFAEIVAATPGLLSDAGDAAVRQLADLAAGQGERDIAGALREVRATLGRMRAGHPLIADDRQPGAEAGIQNSEPRPENSELSTPSSQLADAAYQALLRAASRVELIAVARDYPALLEARADAALAARTDAALDEGNERLARAIEAQREALAELRAREQGALIEAARALLAAGGEDAVADVIARLPILLTDAAQDALSELATAARAEGDEKYAEYAISCRAMLRQVRAGLEEN